MLKGKVVKAAAGLIGFDASVPVSAAAAKAYAAKGFRFCVRYVSRTDAARKASADRGTPDLTEAEGKAILAAGLALMAVQHVAAPGWTPSIALGKSYGEAAARYVALAGLPGGVNLWLDLEGVKKGAPAAEITGYCNAWFKAVEAAGYVSGVYVGFNTWLTPTQLFLDLATKHYWRAEGAIPEVAHRGYQLFQHVDHAGKPNEFDRDVTATDALGGQVLWLAPN